MGTSGGRRAGGRDSGSWDASMLSDLCPFQGFAGKMQSSSAFRLEIIPQHTSLFFLVIFHFLSHFQLVYTLDLKLLVYSLGAELSRNGLLPAGVCVGRRLLHSQEMFGT